MHAIEKELTKLLKLKAGADEDRQKFLQRLVKGAGSLEDDAWEELQGATQDWLNSATKALKGDKELPDFEEDKKTTRVTSAKGGRAKGEGEDADDKKPAKKPAGMSSVMLIRHYLVDHPDANNDEILQYLEKGGFKVLSTVAIGTVRSDFRGVVRVLQEKGLFKRDVTLGKV
jgi:hypothetical protein